MELPAFDKVWLLYLGILFGFILGYIRARHDLKRFYA